MYCVYGNGGYYIIAALKEFFEKISRNCVAHVCYSTVAKILVEKISRTTVEPLNKGHLRTEGIVPYSEVVPYWEFFQKNDVKSPLKNRELISSALFQWKHSTSSC